MTKFWVSIDVEPDIAEYLRDSYLGLQRGLPNLLDLFRELEIPVDFFVLGEVAERFPELVRQILRIRGEVGSHGYHHVLFALRNLGEQRRMLSASVATISRILNRPVRMFRAPNFSANEDTLRLLPELGFRYDSSMLPGRVLRKWRLMKVYDHRDIPREPYLLPRNGSDGQDSPALIELPVTENPLQPGTPIGLGFLNTHSARDTLRAARLVSGSYVSFLIHPWEATELNSEVRSLPAWLRSACRSDLRELRIFFETLVDGNSFATASELASHLEGGI